MTNLKTLFLFPILYDLQHKQEWSLWLTQKVTMSQNIFTLGVLACSTLEQQCLGFIIAN